MNIELHARFYGEVQGVGFRATVRFFAQRLELVGKVSNRSDGCVELIAQGPRTQLEQLLHDIKQKFDLNKIELDFCPPTIVFQSFEIER